MKKVKIRKLCKIIESKSAEIIRGEKIIEVLAQKNLVDNIEQEIKAVEERKKFYDEIRKCNFFSIYTTDGIGFMFIVIQALSLFSFKMPFNSLVFQFCRIASLIFLTGDLIFRYKNHVKEIHTADAVDCELDYLRKQLVEEKEKLEVLYTELEIEKVIINFSNHEVQNSKRLAELKAWREFYNYLGYYYKKFYRIYKRGKLESVLSKNGCPEDQIQAANDFIEEKGHSFVMTKKEVKKKDKK